MIATAPAEHYRQTVSGDRPPPGRRRDRYDLHPAAADAADRGGTRHPGRDRRRSRTTVPVLAVFMTAEGRASRSAGRRSRDPRRTRFPEDAARALAHAASYGVWRNAPEGETPSFDDARAEEAGGRDRPGAGRPARWLEPERGRRACCLLRPAHARQRRSQTPREAGRCGRATRRRESRSRRSPRRCSTRPTWARVESRSRGAARGDSAPPSEWRTRSSRPATAARVPGSADGARRRRDARRRRRTTHCSGRWSPAAPAASRRSC